MKLSQEKVGSEEEITDKAVITTLKRALRFYSILHAEDGHWPGDYDECGWRVGYAHRRVQHHVLYRPHLCLSEAAWRNSRRSYVVPLSDGIPPMSYLYGKRYVAPINGTILSLRREFYVQPYHQIDWNATRNQCAKEDLYYPHPFIQDILWAGLHKVAEPILTHWPFYKLRHKGLSTVMQHIHYEDENTHYVCLGPVNKIRKDSLGKPTSWYRHIWKGAWSFSTPDNGWPVSDTTAEGLKPADMQAALLLSRMSSDIVGEAIEQDKLYDAVNVVLSFQNNTGGFASYELTRSYAWLEVINPAETFGDMIIDY
ncbi:hypothetical protein ACH5RR_006742 [Cinchona calisaya]|uniref:Cycloartenol synthase n=1 Tax=Cinchona calisaya TaxID=153742 RepID=A0ABD3APV2_9GENT